MTDYKDLPFDIRLKICKMSVMLCEDDKHIIRNLLSLKILDRECHQYIVNIIDPMLTKDCVIKDMDKEQMKSYVKTLPYKVKRPNKAILTKLRKRDSCGVSVGMKEAVKQCFQEYEEYMNWMEDLIQKQIKNEIEQYRLYGLIFQSVAKESIEFMQIELQFRKKEWKEKKTTLSRNIKILFR